MRLWSVIFLVVVSLGISAAPTDSIAQNRTIALRSGETIELHTVYWVSNCRSIMIGLPPIEILEGQEYITLSMKEGSVLPRRQECANRVPGGILMATAKDVKERMEGKLIYRLKYKTKDGERPQGYTFGLVVVP